MGTLTVLGILVAWGLWCLLRILGALVGRLGDRLAAWVFPEGQAVTYRLAIGLAALTQAVSPSTILFLLVKGNGLFPTLIFFRSANTWKGPEGAIEELREGFASADGAVRDPVRLVWPLLSIAVNARLRNGLQLLLGGAMKLVWLPLTLTGPAIGGLIRGWTGVVGLCLLSPAGFVVPTLVIALGLAMLGLVGRGGTLSYNASVYPVGIGIGFAVSCQTSATYPLADLGSNGTWVVVGLAGTMLAYFTVCVVRGNLIDPMVDAILMGRSGKATEKHRLRVTRLHLAGELAAKVTQVASLYGVATFAVFAAFELGPPTAWGAAGSVATILFCYSWASDRVVRIIRPPVCIGDDLPGGDAETFVDRAAPASSGRPPH